MVMVSCEMAANKEIEHRMSEWARVVASIDTPTRDAVLTLESIVVVGQIGQGLLSSTVGREERRTRLDDLRRQGRRAQVHGGTQGRVYNDLLSNGHDSMR